MKDNYWLITDDVEQFNAECSNCGCIEDSRVVCSISSCKICGVKISGVINKSDYENMHDQMKKFRCFGSRCGIFFSNNFRYKESFDYGKKKAVSRCPNCGREAVEWD